MSKPTLVPNPKYANIILEGHTPPPLLCHYCQLQQGYNGKYACGCKCYCRPTDHYKWATRGGKLKGGS